MTMITLTEIEEEEDIGMNKCVICNKELQAIEINIVPCVGKLCNEHVGDYKRFVRESLRDFINTNNIMKDMGLEKEVLNEL